MAQQNAVLSVQLIKKDGKLVHKATANKQQYKDFMDSLEEGQIVNVFFDANKGVGSYLQLSKIHVCIREMSQEVGYSFEEMKDRVKEHAGLKWYNAEGSVCKSFADCSAQELSVTIEALLELGDMVNINFRQVFPKHQKSQKT
tara:strand:- start:1730 stop:2158 length:429 start_codon:yes stop_codon:yes gene_type:complete